MICIHAHGRKHSSFESSQKHPDQQKRAKMNRSLKNISVELFLSVAKEFANHLPTQAFPLQEEVGNTHRSVRDVASFNQILDPLFWLPRDTGKRNKYQERHTHTHARPQTHGHTLTERVRIQSKSVIIPVHSKKSVNRGTGFGELRNGMRSDFLIVELLPHDYKELKKLSRKTPNPQSSVIKQNHPGLSESLDMKWSRMRTQHKPSTDINAAYSASSHIQWSFYHKCSKKEQIQSV